MIEGVQIRTIVQSNSILSQAALIPMNNEKKLFICVCSSGDRDTLDPCVESLRDQVVPAGYQLTILVIDNSADALLRERFVDLPAGGLDVHCIHEPVKGIPFARNAAISYSLEAKADWIAFLDDDELAPRQWIARLIQCHETRSADVVVGGVQRAKTREEAIALARSFTSAADFQRMPVVKTAVTSNVLFDARFVREPIGLRFDEGMVFGGSDREFFMRAVMAGAKIIQAESELVFEFWPAERIKPIYILQRWFRYGVSFNYRYRKNYPFGKALLLVWLMCFFKLGSAILKGLLFPLRVFIDKRPIHRVASASVADVAYAAGCVAPFFGFRLGKYY